jgi:predicted nuclease of restriction endonuclease-like RecB superfamily
MLQFSANGRNVSDYKLSRSDIEFIFEECGKWLRNHPKEKSDEEISKEVTDALIRSKLYTGSSRAAALLRKIADNFDD